MRAERIWEARRCDEAHADVVARELGVSPVTARLLCIRGLGDLDGARRFLSPSLDDLHDPFRLTDMAVAVDRILGGDCPARADRDPWRLRCRWRHVDRDSAARTGAARRGRRSLHSRASARRLRIAAGGSRAAARRRRAPGHFRRLRNQGRRSSAARRGSRTGPDHHGSPRTRRGRCRRRSP